MAENELKTGRFHWSGHAKGSRITTSLKRATNSFLSIPSGRETTLKNFFIPGTLQDPALALTMRGPCRPAAPPSDNRYGGLGASLGDSKACKPQNGGGWGCTLCPQISNLSYIAQDRVAFGFGAV